MKRMLSVYTLALAAVAVTAAPSIASTTAILTSASWGSVAVSQNRDAELRLWMTVISLDPVTCTVKLKGPKSRTYVGLRGQGWVIQVPTSGLPTGTYSGKARCNGKGAMVDVGDMIVVPKGAPVEPTCTVTESGMSVRPDGESGSVRASVGFVLANTNKYVALKEASVLVNLKDSSGRLIYSNSLSVSGLSAGQTRPQGFDVSSYDLPKGSTPAAVHLFPTCRDAASLTEPRSIPTGASVIQEQGQLVVSGVVANTTDAVWTSWSSVTFVTRDSSGRITGGGKASVAGEMPPGSSSLWEDTVEGLVSTDQASIIDAVLTPEVAD